MMDKLKEHIDKVVAASIVSVCIVIAVCKLLPDNEQVVTPEKVRGAMGSIENAIEHNKAPDIEKRDYAGVLEKNMGTSEGLLKQDRVAWKFWPQPPFVQGAVIDRPPVFHAKLTPPKISLGGVWVGRGAINVSFGSGDENWQSRAIVVWRKPASDADWPPTPLLTIKVGADGTVSLPPNVTAAGAGYEIAVGDLEPRVPYEYRICTAAVFPVKVRRSVGAVEKDGEIQRPADATDFLPVSGDLKPFLSKLLLGEAQAESVLGASPFATRFSDAVKVELPGDVQIRLSMMEANEEGKYIRGAFTIRRWISSLDKWVEKGMVRVDIGKDIKGEALERIDGKPVKLVMDACATLLELKVDMRDPPPVIRLVPKKDPITGRPTTEMVEEQFVGPKRRVQLAVVKDKRTGEKFELMVGPEEWWPKGLQIAPKTNEPKVLAPAGPVVPGPTPKTVVRPPAPPPAAPVQGPGEPGPAPVSERRPEQPAPPSARSESPIDLNKPPPPDASPEVQEAYERAKRETELKRQESQSSNQR